MNHNESSEVKTIQKLSKFDEKIINDLKTEKIFLISIDEITAKTCGKEFECNFFDENPYNCMNVCKCKADENQMVVILAEQHKRKGALITLIVTKEFSELLWNIANET